MPTAGRLGCRVRLPPCTGRCLARTAGPSSALWTPRSVTHGLLPARALSPPALTSAPVRGPALGGVAGQPPAGTQHGDRTEPGNGGEERQDGQEVKGPMVPGVGLQRYGSNGVHQRDQHELLQDPLAAPPKLVPGLFVVGPGHHPSPWGAGARMSPTSTMPGAGRARCRCRNLGAARSCPAPVRAG